MSEYIKDVRSVKMDEINLADTRFQTRLDFDDAEIHELVEDIEANGLRNPIGIWRREDGSLIILYGFQRVKAFQLLNRASIPAKVYDNLTLKQAYTQNLSDNIRHTDLTDLEIALRLRFFREKQGYGLEDLVSLLGKGEATVYNLLRLTELEQPLQKAVHRKQIGLQQALEIARFPDSKRLDTLEETIQNGFSVRELKRLRADASGEAKKVSLNLSPDAIADMIRSLSPESQQRIIGKVINVRTRLQYDAVRWDRKLDFGYDEYYDICIDIDLFYYEDGIKVVCPKIPRYGCERRFNKNGKAFLCPNPIEYVVLAFSSGVQLQPLIASLPTEQPRRLADPLDYRSGWAFWCKECIREHWPDCLFHDDYYWCRTGGTDLEPYHMVIKDSQIEEAMRVREEMTKEWEVSEPSKTYGTGVRLWIKPSS